MNQINQITNQNTLRKFKTIDLVITGMFAALICVLSPFSIPTQPIPFTLSLFTIFLTGAVLAPRYAMLATITYLLIGLCGVPVFSNFGSGLGKFVGPTGGYLMSYPLMAFITSLFYKYVKRYKAFALLLGMFISLALCYLLGTIWFTLLTDNSFKAALSLCVIPYIPFDLLKIAFAVSLGLALRRTILKHINNGAITK